LQGGTERKSPAVSAPTKPKRNRGRKTESLLPLNKLISSGTQRNIRSLSLTCRRFRIGLIAGYLYISSIYNEVC
ncbi:hypothetical protein NPIL_232141, partial [Nephila pilipes]